MIVNPTVEEEGMKMIAGGQSTGQQATRLPESKEISTL